MTGHRPHRPLRLLLVDDEQLVCGYLAELLTARGFLVVSAADGEAALQLAREEQPDLVLSDVAMPRMDGMGLLAALRADPGFSTVPVFLMSANPDAEEPSLSAGAARFFHKPIGDVDLLARVLEEAGTLAALGEGLYRALLEATPSGVVVTDAGGRVTWANRAYLDISGYALDELRGRKPGDILQGPGTDAVTVARIRRALAGRRACTEGLLNYDRQGQAYWATLEISPLHVDGVHLGFFAFVRSLAGTLRRGTALPVPAPTARALGDGVSSLHRHLGDAMTCLVEAASEGSAPRELQSALVSVLAEVARLQGITEWIHDGLADLSSDSHPALPE